MEKQIIGVVDTRDTRIEYYSDGTHSEKQLDITPDYYEIGPFNGFYNDMDDFYHQDDQRLPSCDDKSLQGQSIKEATEGLEMVRMNTYVKEKKRNPHQRLIIIVSGGSGENEK